MINLLNIPSLEKAEKYLTDASKLNSGPWIQHSRLVAEAAKCIAEQCSGMNGEIAYILGLLHDIGRRSGSMQARHALEGYRFMLQEGYEDSARICLTHSFQYKDINAIYDSWDCKEDDIRFIKSFLEQVAYDDYDLLIQLCDALSMENRHCVLEEKMVASVLKFGLKDTTLRKWTAILEIKDDFEKKTGNSIYNILTKNSK